MMRNVVIWQADLPGSLVMVTIQFRAAGNDDSEKVTRLLSSANEWPGFNHEGSIVDFWDWRYRRNPLGPTNEIVAVAEDRALSHAGSLPVEVRIGQKVRRCAQLSDLYTDPGSRGQGLMESITNALFAADERSGIEVELAFPSPAGYELTMKAGFTELPVNMGHYELIVNPGRFFRNVKFGAIKRIAYDGMRMMKGRGSGPEGSVEVFEVRTMPDDLVALTDEFEGRFELVFHRDDRYLRWRYEHPEGGAFRLLVASESGRTAGFAVLRPYRVNGKGFMDLVDLVALPENESAIRALIDGSVDLCRQEDADTLQAWLPTDHPFLPILGRIGFLLRQPMPGERKIRLVCRQMTSDPELENALASNMRCHIVLGDTDWA